MKHTTIIAIHSHICVTDITLKLFSRTFESFRSCTTNFSQWSGNWINYFYLSCLIWTPITVHVFIWFKLDRSIRSSTSDMKWTLKIIFDSSGWVTGLWLSSMEMYMSAYDFPCTPMYYSIVKRNNTCIVIWTEVYRRHAWLIRIYRISVVLYIAYCVNVFFFFNWHLKRNCNE